MASQIKCNKFDKKQLLEYFKLRISCTLGSKWILSKQKEINGERLYYFKCKHSRGGILKKCESKCLVTLNLYTKKATIFHNEEDHFH